MTFVRMASRHCSDYLGVQKLSCGGVDSGMQCAGFVLGMRSKHDVISHAEELVCSEFTCVQAQQTW